MKIGIANEQKNLDRRVALIPSAVHALCELGCEVVVESGAGVASGFTNEKYAEAGAGIVYSKEEAFGMSDLVMKVAPLRLEECSLLGEGQTVCSFFHLAISAESVVRESVARKPTLIGYEIIENEQGELPVLKYISHIAGQMCVLIAARCLQSPFGGRGIILGGIPGIPPASVVIIGAGNVGCTAADTAFRLGAQVIVLDQDVHRLQIVHERLGHHVTTMLSNSYNIAKTLAFADVAIGAVLERGERTPKVVSESIVRAMKDGSVIVDLSIDQGGCFETSRPTTLENPTYVQHGVVHYCVPNITSAVARITSVALSNVILPYISSLAEHGTRDALRRDPGMGRGVYVVNGRITNALIAQLHNLPHHAIETIL